MRTFWLRLGPVIAVVAVAFLVPVRAAVADYIRDGEWYLSTLDVAQAHAISQGAGVTIGLIDTGVDSAHADLAGNVLAGGQVPGSTGNGLTDTQGHGTEMAGLIVGHGHGADGGAGVLGLAPKARLLSYQPELSGVGTANAVAYALNDAVAKGARVVNMSFGGATSPMLAAAVKAAEAADVVLVAAAGNASHDSAVPYPAAYPGVVAVASVNQHGDHAVSTSGPEVLLSAPGAGITSTARGNSYYQTDGTSDSAAIVSGVAALIRSKYPQMSATEVIHRLTTTATDKGAPGRDAEYGYGIVNPVAALTADVPPLTPSASAANPITPTHTTAAASPKHITGRTTLVAVLAVAGAVVLIGLVTLLALRSRRTTSG